jgi:hypothetical protein
MNHTDYDTYGNLPDRLVDTLHPGDLVEYIDSRTITVGKQKKKTKVSLFGIWDGEKVQFNDDECTLVRAPQWLHLKLNGHALAIFNQSIENIEKTHSITYEQIRSATHETL